MVGVNLQPKTGACSTAEAGSEVIIFQLKDYKHTFGIDVAVEKFDW